jgi:hypothetical protein
MSRGPVVANDLWAQVVVRADGRCECTGYCGRSHTDRRLKTAQDPRCQHVDAEQSPLHAVPRNGETGVAAMRLGPPGLVALCDDCDKGVQAGRRRAQRKHEAANPGTGTALFPGLMPP